MQMLALDVWNGTLAQANSFITATGITYPLLRNASVVSTLYRGGYDYTYVIGGDGKVFYRDLTGFNGTEVYDAVAAALEELVTDNPPAADVGLQLAAPSPNPFNPSTQIEIQIGQSDVPGLSLEVLDVRGRRVRTLLRNVVIAAPGLKLRFDGRDERANELPSGVYWFRLSGPGIEQVVRGALVR